MERIEPGNLIEQELTSNIIGGFYTVYNSFGFGYGEHVCAAALERELNGRGLKVDREVSVAVYYEGEIVAWQRLDMLVNERVVVEIKTGERLHPSAHDQLLNYLRCTSLEIGLLFHFGPRPSFRRLIHTNDRKPGINRL